MAMAFDPNRWTLRTQEAVQAAVEMARTQAHPGVTPDHLVAALVGQQEGVVLPILGKVGGPQLSRDLRAVMEAADTAREELHDQYLSTEHLLLALADRIGVARDELLTA